MKRITFLMLSLCMALLSFAHVTVKVQGIPRTDVKSPVLKEVGSSNIDVNKIERWIGSGSNNAVLAIEWNDGKDFKILVWGYKWDGDKTGADMINDVAAADPSFYALRSDGSAFGSSFGGFGYDANGDGVIGLMKNGKECPLTNGVYVSAGTDFDNYTAKDPKDYWNSGWNKGYWSYWVGNIGGSLGYSGVGASGRKLANNCIDGWTFSSFSGGASGSMNGEIVYLSALKSNESPYAHGVFVVNEDWYGHQNSTLNFLSSEGEWTYRVIQKENPGVELGCTAQYGTIYGDKFYIMAKQDKDPGASVQGARLTICDAKTMKVIKQITTFSTDDKGNSNADGRGFLGVNEHKAYIGTSNGIFIFDIDHLEIIGKIDGTANPNTDSYGSLYFGQIGNMVRVNDKVFAVHQQYGLLVIDPETDKVITTVAAPDGWGFGSVVLSKDGNLWLSLASTDGMGTADNRLMKLNPNSNETSFVTLPAGIYGPGNSWYAWTPDCFCASATNNVLYWNGGENSWFSNTTIFKYDIDTNKASVYLDYSNDKDGWKIYGCSFRVDPVTDNAYISLYKDFGSTDYVLRKYDNKGAMLAEYPMITNYWFPSLPVFPDNEAPVVTPLSETVGSSAEKINLAEIATDADNMDAAIVKTIASISDTEVLSAVMQGGDLVVTPKKDGTSKITIKVNSNGKVAECVVSVTVSGFVGVDDINAEDATEVARYTLDGRLLTAPERGVNIIRMSDGTVKKVLVK